MLPNAIYIFSQNNNTAPTRNWYPDSRAYFHVTRKSQHSSTSSCYQIFIGNGQCLSVHFFGSFFVYCYIFI